MAISFTISDTIQLTDGRWNNSPTPAGTPWPTQSADLSGLASLPIYSGILSWTAMLDLDIIGDFNSDQESLFVDISGTSGGLNDGQSILFDPDTTNDKWFAGEATGPTNGVTNPLLGAQASEGNVTVNGHTSGTMTNADIDTIINDTAVFTADSSVHLTGDLGAVTNGLAIDFTIAEPPADNNGVDIAQIEMDLTLSSDWSGRHAISNVVFYLENTDGEIEKIKLDNWSDCGSYKTTAPFDFSEATIEALAATLIADFDADEWTFAGMTLKAGNNFEAGFAKNQTQGEGQILFGDIIGDYGKLNMTHISVDACDVLSDYFLIA